MEIPCNQSQEPESGGSKSSKKTKVKLGGMVGTYHSSGWLKFVFGQDDDQQQYEHSLDYSEDEHGALDEFASLGKARSIHMNIDILMYRH